MPMFYIGSSYVNKIQRGYHGSVSSKKYKKIWNEEIKNNPKLFNTNIISYHENDTEARKKELKLQKLLNVVNSTLYINESYARVNGFHGRDVKKENHPRWGSINSIEHRNKISKSTKGRIPWNKGTTGQIPWNKGLTGSIPWNKGKTGIYSKEILEKISRSEYWMVTSPAGIISYIKNLSEFCRINNLTKQNMSRVASGKSNYHKGWKCVKLDKSH
jgi:hypothetical protein